MKVAVVSCFRLFLVLLLATFMAPSSHAGDADWVDAGKLFSQFDANRICPNVCGNRKWDGNWNTTYSGGAKSYCSCLRGGTPGSSKKRVQSVETTTIGNNAVAQFTCPRVCGSHKWDGNWRNLGIGKASCDCEQ